MPLPKPRPSSRLFRSPASLCAGLAMMVWAAVLLPAHAANPATTTAPTSARQDKQRQPFPPAPPARDGALPAETQKALADLAPALRERRFPSAAVKRIGDSGDPRLGWVLYDLLRFAGRDTVAELVAAFEKLTGSPLPAEPFTAMGDACWPGTCRRHRATARSSATSSC